MGGTEIIVLDTQTLIWWTTVPEYISKRALQRIRQNTKKGKILLSSISVWEVYLLIQKGRVRFTIDTGAWLEKVEKTPYFQFVPVDNTIAAKSVMLPEFLHKDPADRIIIATARQYGAILITSDKRIRAYPHVQSLW